MTRLLALAMTFCTTGQTVTGTQSSNRNHNRPRPRRQLISELERSSHIRSPDA